MSLIIKRQPEGLEPSAVDNQQAIHLLPCKIYPHKQTATDNSSLTGPVDRFFHPYTKPKASKTEPSTDDVADKNVDTTLWHASLRGKPLTGVELDVPHGYVGLLCNRTSSKAENANSTIIGDLVADDSCGDVLKQLMYWNWDRIPSREDPLLSAFDWVRVSEAIMTDTD